MMQRNTRKDEGVSDCDIRCAVIYLCNLRGSRGQRKIKLDITGLLQLRKEAIVVSR